MYLQRMNFYFSYTLLPTSTSSILHAKLDDGMANNFSSRRSFELIFLPTGVAIRVGELAYTL